MNDIELLSPAGSFETALAAFAAGADAVYLGLDAFSARADAVNFTDAQLRDLLALARRDGPARKVYVTFNTLLDDAQLPEAARKLALLDELRPDGLIVQDLGVARLVRRHFPHLELHASTQLVAHNLEGVLALRELGFTRVVLARELSIEDIRSITRRCGCEIEVFVHGALCYSLSGLCLFSALEKNRSGNRGRCAYCCRLAYTDAAGTRSLPFSMRDLRLDDHLEQLRDAGVASLKIEGRMKSPLYVSTVTAHYRELHDGLQFASEGGKPVGFGISDLRVALSRSTVFSVPAGSDVEVLVPETIAPHALVPGATVYCSASNEVKRRFPIPSFRPSSVTPGTPVNLTVTLAPTGITAAAVSADGLSADATLSLDAPTASHHPERTEEAVRKAFARLGGTAWALASLTLDDPDRLFVPASALNDLRRLLVEHLDAARDAARARTLADVEADIAAARPASTEDAPVPARVLKLRLDQPLPDDVCSYDELVVAIGHAAGRDVERTLTHMAETLRARAEATGDPAPHIRLALPVFTPERAFNALRSTVKHMVKAGITSWEAADLAGLRLLAQQGLADLTADWSLYAFNRPALAQFAELGLVRCVASPENAAENLHLLATETSSAPPHAEFLIRQNTPLFLSLTRPATPDPAHLTGLRGDTFTSFPLNGLWITTRTEARRFRVSGNAATTRVDLSWDPARGA